MEDKRESRSSAATSEAELAKLRSEIAKTRSEIADRIIATYETPFDKLGGL